VRNLVPVVRASDGSATGAAFRQTVRVVVTEPTLVIELPAIVVRPETPLHCDDVGVTALNVVTVAGIAIARTIADIGLIRIARSVNGTISNDLNTIPFEVTHG
jgi:hypothetical protein